MTVDLYSVLPGTQVSADEILEAELITVQILQATYPDMDLREGTGARDLAVRPAATLLALINKALLFYFTQNTIRGVTDSTPQSIVDDILSNWFMSRRAGSNAVINGRLFFARQKDIVLPADVFFSPDNTLKYFSADTISIPSASLIFDSSNNEYFYDVDLTAEQEGETYNISSGSLLYFSNFDPYFLHAEVNFLSTPASSTESNSEFIARTESEISTRNLINVPSIASRMLADFSALDGVTSIGMGDPEMIRDYVWAYAPLLSPPRARIHTGGFVDVYCRVPLTTSIVQLTSNDDAEIQLGGAIYNFRRSEISGGPLEDTIPFYDPLAVTSITRTSTTATVTTDDPHAYTTGDEVTILGALPAGYNGTFVIIVTGADIFTYAVPNTLTTPATGTITANTPVEYTTTNFYGDSRIASDYDAVVTANVTTVTVELTQHGMTANRYIEVSGVTGANAADYNGPHRITEVLDEDTFVYKTTGGIAAPGAGTYVIALVIPNQDYGFSDRAIRLASFDMSHANSTASFEIDYFQDIDIYQAYLEDEVRRVMCADLLARGYNIYSLTVNIVGYESTAPSSILCTDVTTAYLGSLSAGQAFIMSDLESALNFAGVTTIRTPIDVTYEFFNRDLTSPMSGTIPDYLVPDDRTAIFVLHTLTTDSITI